jgi:hypothetical protein
MGGGEGNKQKAKKKKNKRRRRRKKRNEEGRRLPASSDVRSPVACTGAASAPFLTLPRSCANTSRARTVSVRFSTRRGRIKNGAMLVCVRWGASEKQTSLQAAPMHNRVAADTLRICVITRVPMLRHPCPGLSVLAPLSIQAERYFYIHWPTECVIITCSSSGEFPSYGHRTSFRRRLASLSRYFRLATPI